MKFDNKFTKTLIKNMCKYPSEMAIVKTYNEIKESEIKESEIKERK